MPTYDYKCEKCGLAFEVFQSMADQPLTVCPKDHCRQKTWGKGKVKRQIGSGAGLIFKGSGFYITDYRSENYKSAAKKESEGGKSPAKNPGTDGKSQGATSKPESKPAKKPAAKD